MTHNELRLSEAAGRNWAGKRIVQGCPLAWVIYSCLSITSELTTRRGDNIVRSIVGTFTSVINLTNSWVLWPGLCIGRSRGYRTLFLLVHSLKLQERRDVSSYRRKFLKKILIFVFLINYKVLIFLPKNCLSPLIVCPTFCI